MIFDVNAGSLINLCVVPIQDLKQRGMLDDTLVVYGVVNSVERFIAKVV